ncbi:phage tail assembly chaperone [Clostridium tetani]|uniref:phage tail assembly chaperone n=2 Tax=root TaxID=1 RepID=UPI000513A68B|nr:phage XkdN-like protein [Clostridium tetani]KGI40306.1 phage XkdN-like protein [Clostridium tetani ATCC 9441]
MMDFKDFLMEEFEDAEVIEKTLKIGGKNKVMKFKPISATLGDELRKKCKKVKILKGQRIIETDQDKFIANQIIETTVHPDLKNAELQKAWGVMGAEELLESMKSKMSDGEYADWSNEVVEINGYDKGMQELIEEAKN